MFYILMKRNVKINKKRWTVLLFMKQEWRYVGYQSFCGIDLRGKFSRRASSINTTTHTHILSSPRPFSIQMCDYIKISAISNKGKIMTFEYMTDHCNNAEPSHSALKFFKYKLRASESCSNKMSISLLLEFLSLTRYV